MPYSKEKSITNDSLQRLNLVVPLVGDKCPILIWIGGGAWSYGERDQEMDLAKKTASSNVLPIPTLRTVLAVYARKARRNYPNS